MAFVSRKEQIENSIEACQVLHSSQDNPNGNRALVEAQKELLDLHVIEVNKEEQEAISLSKTKTYDVWAFLTVMQRYSATWSTDTTTQLWTTQSEDYMYRMVYRAMWEPYQNKAKTDIEDLKYHSEEVMPTYIPNKDILSYSKDYAVDDQSSSAYSYPMQAIFLIPLKNTNDVDTDISIPMIRSVYSSNYSNAVVSMLTPNANNSDTSLITDCTFQNLNNYNSSNSEYSNTQTITIPANTSVIVMIVASGRYYTDGWAVYSMSIRNSVDLRTALTTEWIKCDAIVTNNINSWKITEVPELFKIHEGITDAS